MAFVETTTPTGTLAQQALPRRGILANEGLANTLLVIAGALFVALCAQIRVPLPFTPVPITGQTLGVLMVGGLLGTRLGLLSMVFYLLTAAIGFPFFAGGESGWTHLQGATAGYLFSYPLAAALVGWLATRGWDGNVGTTIVSMLLGSVIIYALGVGWLAIIMGSLGEAIVAGMLPFLVGDLIKIGVAALALPGGWQLLKMLRKDDQNENE